MQFKLDKEMTPSMESMEFKAFIVKIPHKILTRARPDYTLRHQSTAFMAESKSARVYAVSTLHPKGM